MPFVVNDTRDGSKQNGNYYIRVPPPVYLPSVCLMSPYMIKSPKSFSSEFAYCKQSKTGGGMAWEQG